MCSGAHACLAQAGPQTLRVSSGLEPHTFTFDDVAGETCTQADIFTGTSWVSHGHEQQACGCWCEQPVSLRFPCWRAISLSADQH